jgi:enoyl-CoA hydratase/carnithine racemase
MARAALTGERFTALDAVAAGIATEALPEEEVLPRAIEIAEGLAAKNRSVIGAHKSLLYGDAIAFTKERWQP